MSITAMSIITGKDCTCTRTQQFWVGSSVSTRWLWSHICRNAERGEEWNFTSKKSFGQGESTLLWIQLCAKDGGLTKWFNIDYGFPPTTEPPNCCPICGTRSEDFFVSLSNNLFHAFPQSHLEFLPEKLTAICKANFMNWALQVQQPHCCSGLRP